MAFKDWGFFPYVAERLAIADLAAVSFNFSLNGVEGNGNRITLFANFESNTISRELDDLHTVVDAVVSTAIGGDSVDPRRIGLLGHSRGGGLAILHAAADRRIGALATWSSIATLHRWTQHQKSLWRQCGFLPLAKDTNASPLRLGIALLEDIEQHSSEYDIVSAGQRLKIPWLIVHGKTDVAVPVSEAQRLYEIADHAKTKLLLIDHTGHLYNAANADEDHYQTMNAIVAETTSWFHHQFLQE